ncbi:MAG TPA: trehalose-phosphatase [Candidatus Limnocylindrales bacterium]
MSDFDGTLSEIVADPEAARIIPLARAALRRLARTAAARPGRLAVAVLSGRASIDVAGRVRVGGLSYLGNHGLESGVLARGARPAGLKVVATGATGDSADATGLGPRVADLLGRPPWLFVETKVPSVAFHYRQAPDPEAARRAVLRALADAGGPPPGQHDGGLEAIEGRRVVEIRPGGSGGKAAAIQRLVDAERPDAVLMLGDDISDAEAFRALARERARTNLHGLAIAVLGVAETPAWVAESGDLVLGSPRDAARVLSLVARLVEAGSGSG